jgi:hypothetical protein
MSSLGNKQINFTDYEVRVWKGTVFLFSKDVNFTYTESTSEDMWLGGLQCNFHEGTAEYDDLKRKLVSVAKAMLQLHPNEVLPDQQTTSA